MRVHFIVREGAPVETFKRITGGVLGHDTTFFRCISALSPP